jgi:D-3-phosphoglycerate dehydrogenase
MCTPHLGASTEEAQAKVAVEAAKLLINFFATGEIRQAVNMPPVDPTTLKNLRGYLDLTYRLGLLLAQVEHSPPNCCRLHYKGEVANKGCHLLSVAFAAGLLEHAMESEVGLINAEILLRERGIELVEHRSSEHGDFSSLITAEVVTDARTTIAAGTLFGNDMPRLVRKGDFQVDSRLEGILLLTTHRDAPGTIGRIGEMCGKHQVNIGCLTVGRAAREPEGEAIGIFTLDSEPPAEALAELSAMEPILRVSLVHLPPHGERPPWMGA